MKSIIVIYDDLFELDRTEATWQDEAQLKDIIKSIMADRPDSEKAEVYDRATRQLVLSYRRGRKGSVVETERYTPRQAGSTQEKENRYPRRMTFWMSDAVHDRLDKVRGHRASFVREAVEEKLERSGDPVPKLPAKPEGPPDRRYHRLFKNLPASIKTFNGRDNFRSPLTIMRTPDAWQVSYGPFTDTPGAPSFQNPDLLSALEYLDRWLDRYNRKWIVGKVIEDN